MMRLLLTSALGLGVGCLSVAADDANAMLRGSFLPKIDYETWEGWQPDKAFVESYKAWPDKTVPEDIQVWCKGFIPSNASSQVVDGHPVVPIKGPGNIPIPGLLGKCAGTDGRSWSNAAPSVARPTDSRFWAWMQVANGHGSGVLTGANCGLSHNYCCDPEGCMDGSTYGQETCSEHCPDSEMNVRKVACWTEESNASGQTWAETGEECRAGNIAAAKAYIQGRGGNPCGTVMGIHAPAASWDVGVAVFPKKRKVTLTGYVDDAPSYECYARAKDKQVWGPTVTLAQIPMDLKSNIAIELVGNSDRPVNPAGIIFDLPEASVDASSVVV